MSSNRFNFTDNRLHNIHPSPEGKRLYFYDIKTPGLRLQVTPAGTLSFQFQARGKQQGRIVTTTIGRYPAMTINQARGKAVELMNATLDGQDIEERARQVRQEFTFDNLFNLWLEHFAKPHKKSWDEDERRYKLYINKPFGNKKLSWFTHTKIRQWHQGITKIQKQRAPKGTTVSPTTANRALALLNTVFNQAAPDIPNPCKGVSKFREQSRDRWLTPNELGRFFAALEAPQTPELSRDYILLSLFTGARRSNVLAMKWTDVDLGRKTWTIPAKESKNGVAMSVPLVDQSLDVLVRRKETASSIFVLPSDKSKTGHYVTPTKAWSSLIKRAGLQGIRLHDLRRTLGSHMAADGTSLYLIGKALGHKHQSTTQVYARVNLDPVRNAMERAAAAMEATKNVPEKVINISESKTQDAH